MGAIRIALWFIGGLLLVLLAVAGVSWWLSRPPARPNTLSPGAVYIERFTTPLTFSPQGDWVECHGELATKTIHCSVTDVHGKTLFEDDFLFYPRSGIGIGREGNLEIDVARTGRNNIMERGRNGLVMVPIIVLRDGRILLPGSLYDRAVEAVTAGHR